jgi:CRISPR-associated protein Csx10
MSKHWPLPECFSVRLTMGSDWHVGSGMGRPGNIDRLIVRDADGLPFVPAKTVRGIWRDSCERLCRGLDGGQLGDWSRLVDRLFGSQPGLAKRRDNEESRDPTKYHDDPRKAPLESAVQIRSARIPGPLRKLLIRDDRRLREAMTFVKPGVKIDRRSGSAQTDFLRFEELARKGTIVEAECRLAISSEFREVASALLIASTKLVERLGGKRRRGAGRCRLEILNANMDLAIAWLDRNESAPTWSSVRGNSKTLDNPRVASSDDPWISVPLLLRLQGPLAVSYRTTGNVVETLDFLPGSYLLPHVTRVFPDLRGGVPSGDVLLLPAYPEVDGECGLPVPMALFAPKGGKGLADRDNLFNRLLQPEPTDGTQLKQMREGYLCCSKADRVHKTPITVHTHNTVQDQPQRPTSDVGGVYTYEAIAPVDGREPILLRSELRLRQSLANQLSLSQPDWWTKLASVVSLGRSRKDDYGSVKVETEPAAEWKSNTKCDGHELLVWLVSDTLIRNDQVRPDPSAAALGQELGRKLGVELTIRDSGDSGVLDELIRIRRLDTWHVGWGLPRPSLVALQAGSCVLFRVVGSIDPAKLAQLEASGIGERTAEGYGQVRFNHPLLTKVPTEWPTNSTEEAREPPTPQPVRTMDETTRKFARLLERECWKQEIRRKCLEIAGNNEERKKLLGWEAKGEQGSPPMSQLGALRGQLMLLRKSVDRQRVIDWLDHLAANNRRKDRWPSIPKVKAFIETEGRIWDIINTASWPTLTANAERELKQELWPLAVRTFFDACIRAHKRELEKAQERKEAAHGA